MLGIIIFMIFVTTFLFIQSVLKMIGASQEQIDKRIDELESGIKRYDYREDELNKSILNRLFSPMIEGVGRFMSRLSPTTKRETLEMLLKRAGQNEKTAVGNWYIKKIIFGLLLPILVGSVFYLMERDIVKAISYVILISATIQLFLLILLKRKVTRRQTEITNMLPDALDLITVSVEAGLSFDGAMDRVIKEMPSALSTEFAIALKGMRMGKTRREGLRELSNRCDVDDLTTLVGALIQADELGVSIGKVLRIQSNQMREKRRQRAREKAMKAPIKLLFPLMFFIFPTIFVILLGPALIQMMDVF